MDDVTVRADPATMKTEAFKKLIRSADTIVAVPTSPEWDDKVAFGQEAFESIAKGDEGSASLETLCVRIDWQTYEPEILAALIVAERGSCILKRG